MNLFTWLATLFMPAETYIVKEGDTLSKIASKLPKGITWRKIWDENRDTISNPDLIYPGQKIRIPKS